MFLVHSCLVNQLASYFM